LETELGLASSTQSPLIVLISRMDQQKGVDLAIDALRSITQLKWQAIILGSGDPKLENAALELQSELHDRLKVKILFDTALSHRLYAAADILLMPSRYEPCGLSQLIAMRYGTIPVARNTGGLRDTIIDASRSQQGTGFTFSETSGAETAKAISSAIEKYKNKTKWEKIVRNAMSQDYSWGKSAQKYCTLYQEVLAA
jgi:starch synthase